MAGRGRGGVGSRFVSIVMGRAADVVSPPDLRELLGNVALWRVTADRRICVG